MRSEAAIDVESQGARKAGQTGQDDEMADDIRFRDELISAVCHDMRSPVGAISIFCDILMASSQQLDENQQRLVGMIGEAAGKLQRILADASELSKIHSGRVVLNRTPVDMREVMQCVMDTLQAHTAIMDIRVSREFSASTTHVPADLDRIFAVVFRLLQEAVSCIEEGGELTITDDTLDGWYVLSIKAVPDFITASVASIPSATRMHVPGTLGARGHSQSPYDLRTCQRVVDAHHGALRLCWRHGFEAEMRLALDAHQKLGQLSAGNCST